MEHNWKGRNVLLFGSEGFGLKNQSLRFRTTTTVSSATMNWYVRIEYLKINVTAGFVNNVDTTVT